MALEGESGRSTKFRTKKGMQASMGKAKLQISLPEDPFYDLKENRSPMRSGGYMMASPKLLNTPKTSRSKERRLECLQWALESAQEQQVALLEGARVQLESARGQVAHLQGQVGQLQGQLSNVAECRHAEHNAYQGEVARLQSEKCGLLHESKALAAVISSLKTEHEKQLEDLVLKHKSERSQYLEDCAKKEEALLKERGKALAEGRELRRALESAQKEFTELEMERNRAVEKAKQVKQDLWGLEGLKKSLEDELEGLRKGLESANRGRDGAAAETRSVKAELASARQGLRVLGVEKRELMEVAKSCRADVAKLRDEMEALRAEVERERAAKEKAILEWERAECARTKARKDLEAALTRLVESQRARSALQTEISQGLEVLAGVKRDQEGVEAAHNERVLQLEAEICRLRSLLERPSSDQSSGLWVLGPEQTSRTAKTSPPGEMTAVRLTGEGVIGFCTTAQSQQGKWSFDVSSCWGMAVQADGEEGKTERPNLVDGKPGHCSFEVGCARSSTFGLKKNGVPGRRKGPVARKLGVKGETGTGQEAGKEANSAAHRATGSSLSTGGLTGSLAGFQGFGRPFALAASSKESSGACGKMEQDETAAGGLHVCSPQAEEMIKRTRDARQGCDTCQEKTGGTSTDYLKREKPVTVRAPNLKKLMGIFRKQGPMSAVLARAMSPAEERRIWGLRQRPRVKGVTLMKRNGCLRKRTMRQLVMEVLSLIAFLVQLERHEF